MRSTTTFLIGAGTAYFFDRRSGKRRRHLLRDRTAAVVRRGARVGARKARFAGGHLRGLVAVGRRLFSRRDEVSDDVTVGQRIRSHALRRAGITTRDVVVDVEAGVATLRGSVGSRSLADDLIAQVRAVPGVRDVRDLMRVGDGSEVT